MIEKLKYKEVISLIREIPTEGHRLLPMIIMPIILKTPKVIIQLILY